MKTEYAGIPCDTFLHHLKKIIGVGQQKVGKNFSSAVPNGPNATLM